MECRGDGRRHSPGIRLEAGSAGQRQVGRSAPRYSSRSARPSAERSNPKKSADRTSGYCEAPRLVSGQPDPDRCGHQISALIF